ncbi:hypothetical protein EDB84DRAFT_1492745 [Lactarius hengduanensis]|nr:hypothetical protein EDB84DRAFT_1492745 [Lactarius hengduanensis]
MPLEVTRFVALAVGFGGGFLLSPLRPSVDPHPEEATIFVYSRELVPDPRKRLSCAPKSSSPSRGSDYFRVIRSSFPSRGSDLSSCNFTMPDHLCGWDHQVKNTDFLTHL